MSERRVLFVVEGKKDEPRLLKGMYRVLMGTKTENMFVYGTTIHHLLRKMSSDGTWDDDLDLVSVLKEDASEEDSKMLDQDFSDVYLVFDMDPQDRIYNEGLLSEAIRFFDDSTENGKLYLNYPMMQSYKHLKEPYDEDFLDRTVSLDDIRKGYKELVDQEAYDGIKDIGKFTEETYIMLIILNLRKANRMMNDDKGLPDSDEYAGWDLSDILEIQKQKLSAESRIFVINTSVFNAVDFNPGLIFDD